MSQIQEKMGSQSLETHNQKQNRKRDNSKRSVHWSTSFSEFVIPPAEETDDFLFPSNPSKFSTTQKDSLDSHLSPLSDSSDSNSVQSSDSLSILSDQFLTPVSMAEFAEEDRDQRDAFSTTALSKYQTSDSVAKESNEQIEREDQQFLSSTNSHFEHTASALEFSHIDSLSRELEQTQLYRAAEESAYSKAITDAELEKAKAKQEVRNLSRRLQNSREESYMLRNQLEQQRLDVERLNLQLSRQTDEHKVETNLAEQKERGLQDRIKALSDEIERQTTRAKRARDALESSMKRDFERQSEGDKMRIKELTEQLDKADGEINVLKEENIKLSSEIQRKSGAIKAPNLKYIPNEKHIRIASSHAATKAMAAALAKTEEELRVARKTREQMRSQFQSVAESKTRLEDENRSLIRQVEQLTENVNHSKSYVDNLMLRTEDLKEDWMVKELHYKQAIDSLKTEKTETSPKVSLSLYHKALEEARSNARAFEEKQQQVSALKQKVKSLTRTTSERKISTPHNRHEEQQSLQSPKPNAPKEPPLSKSSKASPPTPHRYSIVKAAGGKAVLKEKLRKARVSSTLSTQRRPMTPHNHTLSRSISASSKMVL